MARKALRVLMLVVTGSVSMVAIENAAAITLRKPAASAVIVQNDLAIGCTDDATRGRGFKLAFRWSGKKPPNFGHYELQVQHDNSPPLLDLSMTKRKFVDVACNSFVIDSNLVNWHWQVTVFDAVGGILETSEQRPFSFGACRLSNGQACNAP